MEGYPSHLSLDALLELESVFRVWSMSRDMEIFVPSAKTKETG